MHPWIEALKKESDALHDAMDRAQLRYTPEDLETMADLIHGINSMLNHTAAVLWSASRNQIYKREKWESSWEWVAKWNGEMLAKANKEIARLKAKGEP